MSKKNSNVNLKDYFSNEEFLDIYSAFRNKLISFKKKFLVVAVSGGPDSLALTALSNFFHYQTGCKIYYVLIDHNLRKNSSKEAIKVKKLLKSKKINLLIIKNKIKINKNIQSHARLIRYNLLKNFCEKKKISVILTAHNLEDQVETFFIRLSRGSGLRGLSSMRELSKISKKIILLRPLLDINKNQLIKISKIVFKKFYKDPSNKNLKYLRTKIRGLKPILENKGIEYKQIIKSIKNLASSRDTLDYHFDKIYQDLLIKKKERIFFPIKKYKSLNKEMRMRVLDRSIKEISKSYYPPRSKKIMNLDINLHSNKSLKLYLAGCSIFKEKKLIIIKKT